MVIKPDQQKMQQLLSEAITVLCKNGLSYQSHVSVEALIGITLDDNEVFLVSVRETIQNLKQQQAAHPKPLSPTYSVSAARPRVTPNRKRPAPNSTQQLNLNTDSEATHHESAEPAAKKLASDEVIHIKGENESDDESSDTIIQETPNDDYTRQSTDWSGGQENSVAQPSDQFPVDTTSYDTSQLEQFVDFATNQNDMSQEDNKAAVFASHADIGPSHSDPSSASYMTPPVASTIKTSPSRTPQQSSPFNATYTMDEELVALGLNTTAAHRVKGTKRWSCGMCTKVFSSSSNLRNHIKGHLGMLNYKCTKCEKSFWTKQAVEGHMVQHTNEPKFNCTLCSRQFAYRQSLMRHIKQDHS